MKKEKQFVRTPVLYLVIPCYNESEVLEETMSVFVKTILRLAHDHVIAGNSCVLLVDDGSTDDTWEKIWNASRNPAYAPFVKGIRESKNNGHQNALMAGMMYARSKGCDIVITMDADGQDDISVLPEMIRKYSRDFCDIVYGVRRRRTQDTVGKRWTAHLYYRLMHLFGAHVIYDHADFRLLSRRALDALAQYPERNLFLRGIVPDLGFDTAIIEYDRMERMAGDTKYPLRKMLKLALDGITGFSIRPLHMIAGLGFVMSVGSFVACVWALISFLLGNTVPGWTSMTCIVCLVCGVQLLCLGVIGIYVGRICQEVKQRPRYVLSETTEDEE